MRVWYVVHVSSLLCPCSRGGRRQEEGKCRRGRRENQKGISPMRLESGSKRCSAGFQEGGAQAAVTLGVQCCLQSSGSLQRLFDRRVERIDCRNNFLQWH